MLLSNGERLFCWPLSHHVITAGWTYSDGSAHGANDYRTNQDGSIVKPVYAAESGTVDQVQAWDGHTKTGMQSYGNMVRLRHADYNSKTLQTRYAHLSSIVVKVGQAVKEGQLIGYTGETGNISGAHLHFEVILAGVRVNPLNWMDNDFTCANDTVRAHLGTYKSVERPEEQPAQLQMCSVGPVDNATAMLFWGIANSLGIGYSSQYTGLEKTRQVLTIGPASAGDAMKIWNKAKELNAPYNAEYVY